MTKKITAEETLKALRRIVKEKGSDYVYEAPWYEDEYGEQVQGTDCYYSDPQGKPSCMVGVLLREVSPRTYRKLHKFEWNDMDYRPNCVAVDELNSDAGPHVTGVNLGDIFEPEAVEVLMTVQRHQDLGVPWVEAVDEAQKLT